MIKTIFLLGLLMLGYQVVFAEQPPSKTNQANAAPHDKEIQQLIDQLAAKHTAPDNSNRRKQRGLFEPGSKTEPEVEAAYKKLVDIGKPAFPILLANMKDKRYSLSRSYSVQVNHSVGYICGEIIQDQVQVVGMRYKMRNGSDGNMHGYRDYMSEVYKGDLMKWWEANKEKSLKQMKLDALKWKIAWEEKIGFTDAKDREAYMPQLLQKLAEIEAEK